MPLSLDTFPTPTGQRCVFKNGQAAGLIDYIPGNTASQRWEATPWACGNTMRWASLAAAQYYILACAEQMAATGNGPKE